MPNDLAAAPARHAVRQSINPHQIAIEAMRSRGLLPTFAPQALQEAENLRPADAQAGHGDIADLRQLTWFSIDNDDTRNLDQLSVAEPLHGAISGWR